MEENLLILMMGLPYAGKSTEARNIHEATRAPTVCPDAVRRALHGERYVPRAEGMVWAVTKIAVRALFLAGHGTVILDATNTTRARRDEWRSDGEPWVTAIHYVDTPADECRRRAMAAADDDILPVIDRMAEQLEEPHDDEELY